MKRLIIALLWVIVTLDVWGQTKLKGVVSESDTANKVIPFASVVLCDIVDSSKYLYGTITDFGGNYSISDIKRGEYILIASCLGYEKYSTRYVVDGDSSVFDISLTTSINELDEIQVLGRTIEKQYDRTVYTITADNRKLASNSLDLLKNVPQLKVNQLDKSISTNSGGAVKILVDGLSASEQEIVAISKNDIARVEYISFPPARYSDYKAVVNIVRKEQTSGFSAGFDCTNALNAKYGDDMVFFSANMGASKLSVQYSYDYENYKDGYYNSLYKYAVAGVDYSRSEDMHIRKFEKVHKLNFNYSAQKADNYALQFKFTPRWGHERSQEDGILSLGTGDVADFGSNYQYKSSKVFRPVYDFYFSKSLPNKQEVLFNIVGTNYDSDYEQSNLDVMNIADTTLSDVLFGNNDKYSIIGELAYNKSWTNSKLGFGYKCQFSDDKDFISNSFGATEYDIKNRLHKIYTDYSGHFGKLSYSVDCEYSHLEFDEGIEGNKYMRDGFTPHFQLNYNFSDISSLQVKGESMFIEPFLTDLSNNKYYRDRRLIEEGNPALKPYWGGGAGIGYEYNGDRLQFGGVGTFVHCPQYIASVYKNNGDFVSLTFENAKYVNLLNCTLYGQYCPFQKEFLYLGGAVGVDDYKAKFKDGQVVRATSFPVQGSINFVLFNAAVLSYEFTVPSKYVGDRFLDKNENTSRLGLAINADDLSVGLYWYWPFGKSKYGSETFNNDVLYHKSVYGFNENSNMIVLNLALNIHSGRKVKNLEQKIENKDTDSGVMLR